MNEARGSASCGGYKKTANREQGTIKIKIYPEKRRLAPFFSGH
jgi:hypothetical protein